MLKIKSLDERVEGIKTSYAELGERVNVVRCRDCFYSFKLTDQDGNKLLMCTEIGRRGLRETDFCSYGKKC